MYKRWIEKGVLCLNDIIDENGNILTHIQLTTKYGLVTNKMSYNSLVHSIPKTWKHAIKNKNDLVGIKIDNVERLQIGDNTYCINTLSNKQIYSHLIRAILKPPTSVDRWISEFPFFNDNDFNMFYELPYTIVKDTKLHALQYKVLNRIYPCKAYLSKLKIIDHDKCHYCNEYDDISHNLYSCNESKLFWKQLSKWLSNHIESNICISKTDVLFGILNKKDTPLFFCLNYIILHGKSYIYREKLNNNSLFALDFLLYIKPKIEIDEYIYTISDKHDQFAYKYGPLYDSLFF